MYFLNCSSFFIFFEFIIFLRILFFAYSGDCYRVVLDQSALDSTIYIPELSTVCFDCSAPSSTMGGASETVLWQLDNEQLQKNDQFSNGHVLNNGTLLVTDSSKTFLSKEETSLACSNNGGSDQELVNFRIALGGKSVIITVLKLMLYIGGR